MMQCYCYWQSLSHLSLFYFLSPCTPRQCRCHIWVLKCIMKLCVCVRLTAVTESVSYALHFTWKQLATNIGLWQNCTGTWLHVCTCGLCAVLEASCFLPGRHIPLLSVIHEPTLSFWCHMFSFMFLTADIYILYFWCILNSSLVFCCFQQFLTCIPTCYPVAILICLRLNLSTVHNLSLPSYHAITPFFSYHE